MENLLICSQDLPQPSVKQKTFFCIFWRLILWKTKDGQQNTIIFGHKMFSTFRRQKTISALKFYQCYNTTTVTLTFTTTPWPWPPPPSPSPSLSLLLTLHHHAPPPNIKKYFLRKTFSRKKKKIMLTFLV